MRVERFIVDKNGQLWENPAADIMNRYFAWMERHNAITMMIIENYQLIDLVRNNNISYPRLYHSSEEHFVRWENNYLKELLSKNNISYLDIMV